MTDDNSPAPPDLVRRRPAPVLARWKGHEATEQVAIRLPKSLLALLDAAAAHDPAGRAGVVRAALIEYLQRGD